MAPSGGETEPLQRAEVGVREREDGRAGEDAGRRATAALADADCTLCNWNIAVSRPGVPGVAKGGNWTRGTNPERIAEVWRAFRAINPDPRTARGFWGEPEVPVLAGPQIAGNLPLLGRAPQKTPELLLRSSAGWSWAPRIGREAGVAPRRGR